MQTSARIQPPASQTLASTVKKSFLLATCLLADQVTKTPASSTRSDSSQMTSPNYFHTLSETTTSDALGLFHEPSVQPSYFHTLSETTTSDALGLFNESSVQPSIQPSVQPFVQNPKTSRTPCPFMNIAAEDLYINFYDGKSIHEYLLFHFAHSWYGLDPKVVRILAKGAARYEKKYITKGATPYEEIYNTGIWFSDLFDPKKRHSPIHNGYMVRNDDDPSKIDPRKIAALKSSSSDGKYITEKELDHFYKIANRISICDYGNPMDFGDYISHYANRELLMGFFRQYIVKSKDGEKMLPLDLVVNFLEKSILPVSFSHSWHPATVSSIIIALIKALPNIWYEIKNPPLCQ